ncbi:hypothetical protein SDC9_174981 [bioreactor metagenome]|uniref:Uncharacterized protein n=1 Tax=bioreactor metagenome TaxID=1076179 RepID=A0A645GKY1_9ZZZZ
MATRRRSDADQTERTGIRFRTDLFPYPDRPCRGEAGVLELSAADLSAAVSGFCPPAGPCRRGILFAHHDAQLLFRVASGRERVHLRAGNPDADLPRHGRNHPHGRGFPRGNRPGRFLPEALFRIERFRASHAGFRRRVDRQDRVPPQRSRGRL